MHRNMTARLLPWLFVSPALLIIVLVVATPSVGTVFLSLTDWDGLAKPNFIGLDNFARLLKDPVFYSALFNNLKWLVIFCTVPTAFSLLLAILISKITRFQLLYRVGFFLPQVCSTVVTAKIWTWIYNPYYGINSTLQSWGIPNPPLWIGDPNYALYSVAAVDGWRYWGFLMILFLTALHQTDRSLEEAAQIDGARRLRIYTSIIIPQLRPTIMLIVMLTMIWSFAAFDYVYVMTGGGPGHATELIATYMYKEALQNHAPGYASSVALALALLSGIIIAAFGILRKRGWEM